MEQRRKDTPLSCTKDSHGFRKDKSLLTFPCAQGRKEVNKYSKLDCKTPAAIAISVDHEILRPQRQPHDDTIEEEGEGDELNKEKRGSALGGIPWALPPETERLPLAEDGDVDSDGQVDRVSEEEVEDDHQDVEDDVRQKEAEDDHDSSTSASRVRTKSHNQGKRHFDRRKSPPSRGRQSRNDEPKRGREKRGGESRRHKNLEGAEKTSAGNEGNGGLDDSSVAEEECGESGREARGTKEFNPRRGGVGVLGHSSVLDEDDIYMDGHYGPRVEAPPCTVFEPHEGKVKRVGGLNPALVVGLDTHEQLCFVGVARVRCGYGRAELAGYILRPVPWGPYFEAHSPRWMSLLTVRALGIDDDVNRGASDATPGSFGIAGLHCGQGGGNERDAVGMENEIEDAVDRISENFPVVVVLRSVQNGPLNILSAQTDADALYFPGSETAAGRTAQSPPSLSLSSAREAEEDQGTMAGESTRFATCERRGVSDVPENPPPALKLAAQLHLPGLQVVTTDAAGLVPLTVSQSWVQAVDAVLPSSPSRPSIGLILVCGAKGVGKSTMCRLLMNRALSQHPRVAYMDCDIGQPEFTAPGQVSLHLLDSPVFGPPHANIRRPQVAYFIGSSTAKPEPLLFSSAVRALAEHTLTWQQQSSSLAGDGPPPPVVVNTDGWVKGMGEDLLGAVIDAVRPRHIVQILGSSASKTFQLDRLPDGCEVHRVEAWRRPPTPVGVPPTPPRPSAQELRVLRLVAYFVGQDWDVNAEKSDSGGAALEAVRNACVERTGEKSPGVTRSAWDGAGRLSGVLLREGVVYDRRHEIAALLAARRPRRVSWKTIQVRVMNGAVTPGLVQHAINGALVGLVAMPRQNPEKVDEGGIGGNRSGGYGVEPETGAGLMSLAETPLAPCVGLGIVRSVDVHKRLLYVLTPEPLDVLKCVNVLVKGSLQLPMVMLYDPKWCSHPYFSSETLGGDVIKERKLLRRGYEP